jgi:hypothetical protein
MFCNFLIYRQEEKREKEKNIKLNWISLSTHKNPQKTIYAMNRDIHMFVCSLFDSSRLFETSIEMCVVTKV